ARRILDALPLDRWKRKGWQLVSRWQRRQGPDVFIVRFAGSLPFSVPDRGNWRSTTLRHGSDELGGVDRHGSWFLGVGGRPGSNCPIDLLDDLTQVDAVLLGGRRLESADALQARGRQQPLRAVPLPADAGSDQALAGRQSHQVRIGPGEVGLRAEW